MKDQGLRYQLYKAGIIDNDYPNKNLFRVNGWEEIPSKVKRLEDRYEEAMKLIAALARELGYTLEKEHTVGPNWIKK